MRKNYPNSGAQTRYCKEDEGDGLKMPPKARVTVLALIGAALAFHFMPLLVPKRGVLVVTVVMPVTVVVMEILGFHSV